MGRIVNIMTVGWLGTEDYQYHIHNGITIQFWIEYWHDAWRVSLRCNTSPWGYTLTCPINKDLDGKKTISSSIISQKSLDSNFQFSDETLTFINRYINLLAFS